LAELHEAVFAAAPLVVPLEPPAVVPADPVAVVELL
jgi:hypothetical protein